MQAYVGFVVKKAMVGIMVIICLTTFLFFMMRMIPGDPAELLLGQTNLVTQQVIDETRKSWGLDQPVYLQYFYWLLHLFGGDFGISYVTKLPVSIMISSRLAFTLVLMLTSYFLSFAVGIPAGLIAALKRGKALDNGVLAFSAFFYSMPSYWLGLMLMLFFGVYLKILPVSGIFELTGVVLPVVTLALPKSAMVARLTRTEMLEVLSEDYVRTAWAKGLPSSRVILRHALRNALIPITVFFFLYLPWMFGGAIIVEVVFAWPGMGTLLYNSIVWQDYLVVQGIILVIAILTVVCNILGDILSASLDPRIRLEKGRI